MECFGGHNTEIMLPSSDEVVYKNDEHENRQLHCQELIELNDQIAQDNSVGPMNDYAILPAVNLCPITWGMGNLEIGDTGQSGFIDVGHTVNNFVSSSAVRVRRKPRPYSPSNITMGVKKLRRKPKGLRVQKLANSSTYDVYIDKRTGLPFSCDKCKSPHIVDPTRCGPGNRKRPPLPRKYINPIDGRIMLLCNACGIAAKTGRKDRTTKDVEALRRLRDQYLSESMNFAKKLAQECNEPELSILYCPSFNTKGCGCIVKYLFSGLNSTVHERQLKALDLLNYHRRAGVLNRNGNLFTTNEEEDLNNGNSENELHIDECDDNFMQGLRKPHYKCKSRDYEKFALTSRIKLRSEYALCEKATQKILMYSNNFLHKESKTNPERGPRVNKRLKRIARLKPILDMHKEYCCGNRCTRIASSHSNLLEGWRKRAAVCQRDTRRVIAEMLTPTGGSKANCYRFIKMVTGCSVSTIFLVNDHMRKTKGDREPPEHGLKKYWRSHSKSYKAIKKNLDHGNTGVNLNFTSELAPIPSEEELLTMGMEAASTLIQAKKAQLNYLQNKLENAESRLKAAATTTGAPQEMQAETLANEVGQGVGSNIFVLGQDGVIRPWKNDQPYVQIVSQDNS